MAKPLTLPGTVPDDPPASDVEPDTILIERGIPVPTKEDLNLTATSRLLLDTMLMMKVGDSFFWPMPHHTLSSFVSKQARKRNLHFIVNRRPTGTRVWRTG